jgi:hypothetical protein
MMVKAGVDIARDDMLMNYTHPNDMAMDDGKPWRGAREKDPRFFQILLEATSVPGDLILDCTASTGQYSIILLYLPIVTKLQFQSLILYF